MWKRRLREIKWQRGLAGSQDHPRTPLPPAPRAVNLTGERVLGTPAGWGVAPGGDTGDAVGVGDSGGRTHGHTETAAAGGRTPAPPAPTSPLAMCPGNQRATSRPPREKLSRQPAPAAPQSTREASLMAPCRRAQRGSGGPLRQRTSPPGPLPEPEVPALQETAGRLAHARYAAFGDAWSLGAGRGPGGGARGGATSRPRTCALPGLRRGPEFMRYFFF